MKNHSILRSSFIAAVTFTFAILLLPRPGHAANISKTATAGPYTLTLKVLPAESFRGTKPEMTRDGGAQPNYVDGPMHPNHHLVVFVKEDGKPVEHARVSISYRRTSAMGAWKTLPVVRMHETGEGVATTHFGNNVKLAPGSYDARITVDGKGPTTFHFSLPG
jgi:hypothetical protein